MAWVRIEDAVTEHRKHLKAGPAACWLWVCGIAYCQRQLSDGFIPTEALPMIGVVRGFSRLVETLIEVGLFDRVDGGYRVHDYHDYNETREEAQHRKADLSAKRARAGRLGGLKSGAIRHEHSEANIEATAKQFAEANRSPIPSHPIPSRFEKSTIARAEPPNSRNHQKTPIIGKNTHLGHVFCDEQLAYCVPSAVHHKLAALLAPKHAGDVDRAAEALRDWYPTITAKLVEGFVMGDAFRFWQSRFDEAFATPDAPKSAPKRDHEAEAQANTEAVRQILRRQGVL